MSSVQFNLSVMSDSLRPHGLLHARPPCLSPTLGIYSDSCLLQSFYHLSHPGGSEVKVSACNAGDLGSIPGSGRSPGEEMATHSSILAWRIPWMEDPGGLQSMWSQRVGHDWATSLSFFLSMDVWVWDPWCCEQMLWIIASFLFYFLKLWQIYITHSFPGGCSIHWCGPLLRTESRDFPAWHSKPLSLIPMGQKNGHQQGGTLVLSFLGPIIYYVI